MGASSSSSNASSNDGKFIKIGEELIGEEEKAFSSVNIYKVRFLKSKVIDRVIVQLRAEVKVGNLTWTILRSLEDFRQLKDSLDLPAEFGVPFPKTDQRYFSENSEIMAIQEMMSKWLVAAAGVGINQTPMLAFLGVMDAQISETAATKIDLDTLIRTCDTGDILLFKTHGFIPISIRKITSAKYDHVGVVIVKESRGGGREESFLEASGDQYGVHIHNLRNRLLEWYLADARICYRRLKCVRDKRFKEKTNNFIEKVEGRKYGFSIKTLMLNSKDKQPSSKSKFFCSELVTAFYKHLGFIPSFAKSHSYMPGDFAEKESGSRLNLVDAHLEHEILVTKWPKRKARMVSIAEGRKRSLSHRSLRQSCLRAPGSAKKNTKHMRNRSHSFSDIRVKVLSEEPSVGGQDDYIFRHAFEDESSRRRSESDINFRHTALEEMEIDL